MNNRVLLATVFTGYNYGSCLQAFAGRMFLENQGFDCLMVARRSFIKGRNVHLGKLFTILCRSLILKGKSNSLSTYQKQYARTLVGDSAERFRNFIAENLSPHYLSWGELKSAAKESVACFSGSDQIWNSSSLYVDPLYYLRFAPSCKRVAFAPSFGRDFIPNYNVKKMAGWISSFARLSAREDSGVELIKKITGKDATQLIDPTLMLDSADWTSALRLNERKDKYILAYFLDEPSPVAQNVIKLLTEKWNCKVIAIPYVFADMSYCGCVEAAGPKEFLELVKGATVVCTDSFHGTAFSINFHTPFYVFERNYGSASKQSSRILSLLTQMKMMHRYEVSDIKSENNIDFSYSDKVLNEEREKSRQYVINSISSCRKNEV